jgi:hypothetical protein
VLSSSVWRERAKYAFCGGLLIGGVVSALGILLIGSLIRWPLPRTALVVVVVAWTAALAARELGLLSFRLPQNARLVPETVFRHGPVLGPLQFGLEMGTGMRTYVTSGLPYALVAAVALLADPTYALLAGVGFGAGRALMTLSNLGFGPDAAWDEAWVRHQRWLHVVLLLTYATGLACVVLA